MVFCVNEQLNGIKWQKPVDYALGLVVVGKLVDKHFRGNFLGFNGSFIIDGGESQGFEIIY